MMSPSFATEAGNFSGNVRMATASLQISYADGNSIIIGALGK